MPLFYDIYSLPAINLAGKNLAQNCYSYLCLSFSLSCVIGNAYMKWLCSPAWNTHHALTKPFKHDKLEQDCTVKPVLQQGVSQIQF